MAKTNKKLSIKKETLRSLTAEQLGQVAGGTNVAYSVIVPPKGTLGCEPTNGCIDVMYLDFYIKGYP